MNHLHLQNAQRYLKETHEQAYRDHLARKFQPSFRERLARVFSTLALRLESHPQRESLETARY
jgi:hypothetical protein